MNGVNKVLLIGNLGKDPEVFTFANGGKKVRLAIATSEVYKNKNNERVEHTEWHSVILYRGLAETAEKYLKKGNTVYIEGKLKTRFWEDENKSRRYVTEVEAQSMNMLGFGGKKTEEATIEKGEPVIPSVPEKLDTDETFYNPAEDPLPF